MYRHFISCFKQLEIVLIFHLANHAKRNINFLCEFESLTRVLLITQKVIIYNF